VAGFTNVVRVHYLESDGTLDLVIFDQTGAMLGGTGGTGVDAKEISVNVPGVGLATAFINVAHTTGGDVGYSIVQDLIPLFDCLPDVAEPDNDAAHASLIASSTISPIMIQNLTLCVSTRDARMTGDEDWYMLHPPAAGMRINASIAFQ